MTEVICEGGVCRLADASNIVVSAVSEIAPRIAHGYMRPDEFIGFLNGTAQSSTPDSFWAMLMVALLGGFALNLTPCVLPMVPVNLMVIGKSFRRGMLYGLGLAVCMGALGLTAAFGSIVFGSIQGTWWFNASVALVFAVMGVALLGFVRVDFTRFRGGLSFLNQGENGVSGWLSFVFGIFGALLAGACVAPVLISVLMATSDLYARGERMALLLPFALGIGMALPWPFLGAGMKVLPKPGRWMRFVNMGFAVVVFGFAAYYTKLAWRTATGASYDKSGESVLVKDFDLERYERPLLVDCWASWCKNCGAMEQVLKIPEVARELSRYQVVRVQAEDLSELKSIKGLEGVRGLPAFLIFEGTAFKNEVKGDERQ